MGLAQKRLMREAEPANSGHSGHTPKAQQVQDMLDINTQSAWEQHHRQVRACAFTIWCCVLISACAFTIWCCVLKYSQRLHFWAATPYTRDVRVAAWESVTWHDFCSPP